ncbi:hypothetical protein [Hyphococcus lacteus]|uniref:Uncharacterized protein n=1 Tax=Hyphococcus lacteus TaxID=3143536 RepID=A0ABV3Z5K0_9PROT
MKLRCRNWIRCAPAHHNFSMFCALCLKKIENTQLHAKAPKSKEHVIPFAWYPDSTPETVQRWTVPSHEDCNGSFSGDEEYVFRKLACICDPNDEAATGIWDRALRGMQPEKGRNLRDQRSRARAFEKFMKDVRPASKASEQMLKNSLRGLTNTTLAQSLLTIDSDKLERVMTKIVKCISYWINKKPPDKSAVIKHRWLGLSQLVDEGFSYCSNGQLHDLGPGIKIKHRAIKESGVHAEEIVIFLWRSVIIHAIIYWDLSHKFVYADPVLLNNLQK